MSESPTHLTEWKVLGPIFGWDIYFRRVPSIWGRIARWVSH